MRPKDPTRLAGSTGQRPQPIGSSTAAVTDIAATVHRLAQARRTPCDTTATARATTATSSMYAAQDSSAAATSTVVAFALPPWVRPTIRRYVTAPAMKITAPGATTLMTVAETR